MPYGILLILAGGLLIRQLATGRALNIPEDFRDSFTALTRGDFGTISEVAARRGDLIDGIIPAETGYAALAGTSLTATGVTDSNLVAAQESAGVNPLVATAQALASKANNRYVLGTSGTKSYDCSGLAWRTLYETGVYKGPRFTTETFESVARSFATRVNDPRPGDIVIWPGKHMGIVSGKDRTFNALNSKKGIVDSSISGISKGLGTPHYWRLK